MVSDGGVASAGGDQLLDEGGEWFGEHDGFAAESQVYLVAAGVDVIEGESADCGGLLGVEQDKQASDSIVGFEGVVVQQPAGVLPSGFSVEGAGRAVPSGGGEIQADQLLALGPADEVSRGATLGEARTGYPAIEVAL